MNSSREFSMDFHETGGSTDFNESCSSDGGSISANNISDLEAALDQILNSYPIDEEVNYSQAGLGVSNQATSSPLARSIPLGSSPRRSPAPPSPSSGYHPGMGDTCSLPPRPTSAPPATSPSPTAGRIPPPPPFPTGPGFYQSPIRQQVSGTSYRIPTPPPFPMGPGFYQSPVQQQANGTFNRISTPPPPMPTSPGFYQSPLGGTPGHNAGDTDEDLSPTPSPVSLRNYHAWLKQLREELALIRTPSSESDSSESRLHPPQSPVSSNVRRTPPASSPVLSNTRTPPNFPGPTPPPMPTGPGFYQSPIQQQANGTFNRIPTPPPMPTGPGFYQSPIQQQANGTFNRIPTPPPFPTGPGFYQSPVQQQMSGTSYRIPTPPPMPTGPGFYQSPVQQQASGTCHRIPTPPPMPTGPGFYQSPQGGTPGHNAGYIDEEVSPSPSPVSLRNYHAWLQQLREEMALLPPPSSESDSPESRLYPPQSPVSPYVRRTPPATSPVLSNTSTPPTFPSMSTPKTPSLGWRIDSGDPTWALYVGSPPKYGPVSDWISTPPPFEPTEGSPVLSFPDVPSPVFETDFTDWDQIEEQNSPEGSGAAPINNATFSIPGPQPFPTGPEFSQSPNRNQANATFNIPGPQAIPNGPGIYQSPNQNQANATYNRVPTPPAASTPFGTCAAQQPWTQPISPIGTGPPTAFSPMQGGGGNQSMRSNQVSSAEPSESPVDWDRPFVGSPLAQSSPVSRIPTPPPGQTGSGFQQSPNQNQSNAISVRSPTPSRVPTGSGPYQSQNQQQNIALPPRTHSPARIPICPGSSRRPLPPSVTVPSPLIIHPAVRLFLKQAAQKLFSLAQSENTNKNTYLFCGHVLNLAIGIVGARTKNYFRNDPENEQWWNESYALVFQIIDNLFKVLRKDDDQQVLPPTQEADIQYILSKRLLQKFVLLHCPYCKTPSPGLIWVKVNNDDGQPMLETSRTWAQIRVRAQFAGSEGKTLGLTCPTCQKQSMIKIKYEAHHTGNMVGVAVDVTRPGEQSEEPNAPAGGDA